MSAACSSQLPSSEVACTMADYHAQSSSSSSSAGLTAAAVAAASGACPTAAALAQAMSSTDRLRGKDLDDDFVEDASTAASSSQPPDEIPEERLSDFAESDNEQEDAQPLRSAVASVDFGALASKQRWADLEDSEEEKEEPSSHDNQEDGQAEAAEGRQSWADFVESGQDVGVVQWTPALALEQWPSEYGAYATAEGAFPAEWLSGFAVCSAESPEEFAMWTEAAAAMGQWTEVAVGAWDGVAATGSSWEGISAEDAAATVGSWEGVAAAASSWAEAIPWAGCEMEQAALMAEQQDSSATTEAASGSWDSWGEDPSAAAATAASSWEASEAPVEAQVEAPKKKRGKKEKAASSAWAEAETAAGGTSSNRKARSGKASSSSSKEKWWSQSWESSSEWWDSSSSKGSAKDGRSSQQWGSSKAKSQQADRRGARNVLVAKPQCQFFIGIEEENKFKVTRKVLGPHGQFMKQIAEKSGAKLRLRGRGSGFLEGAEQQESTDELMLCVSAPDHAGYSEAVKLVNDLLEGVYDEYRTFCRKAGGPTPELEVQMHEGPRPGSR